MLSPGKSKPKCVHCHRRAVRLIGLVLGMSGGGLCAAPLKPHCGIHDRSVAGKLERNHGMKFGLMVIVVRMDL